MTTKTIVLFKILIDNQINFFTKQKTYNNMNFIQDLITIKIFLQKYKEKNILIVTNNTEIKKIFIKDFFSFFILDKWQNGFLTNYNVFNKINIFRERPHLVIVFNPEKKSALAHECQQENIPVIGILDGNSIYKHRSQFQYSLLINIKSYKTQYIIIKIIKKILKNEKF